MRLQLGRRSLTAITVVYIGLIFFLSSRPYLYAPGPEFHMKDKFAHFLEYGALGFLLTLSVARPATRSRRVAFFLALAIGATVAATDELFQGTVPGRLRDVTDWLADVAGVAVAAGLALRGARAGEPARDDEGRSA
jgi:VanZ family protein